MLQIDYEKSVTITISLHKLKPKSTIQKSEGRSRINEITPLSQTEGLPLNNRVIESNTTTTTTEKLLEMSTTASISNFLTLESLRSLWKSITSIKFSSPYFTPSYIQSYQEDLEIFLILLRLHRESFPELKEVTFGAPPQPYIHVKEYRKPMDIPFHGVLFNAPRHRGPTSSLSYNPQNRNAAKTANFKVQLSDNVKMTTNTPVPIRNFLNDPQIFDSLPRTTEIYITPNDFHIDDIQTYKEDLEIFVTELYRLRILLSQLKKVYFRNPFLTPFKVKIESPKPENVTFYGIYFPGEIIP